MYTWTLEQILEEERRLRRLAEEQVRAYRRLLASLARDLAPDLVDAHRRTDPCFPDNLDVDGWQALFGEIQAAQRAEERGWKPKKSEATTRRGEDATNRRRENATNRRREDATTRRGDEEKDLRANESPSAVCRLPSAEAKRSPSAVCRLPPAPPTRYARLFQDWEREGLVLHLLASTGWSLRHAIDEAVAGQLGIGVGSGSIKRLFRRLEKQGLVASHVHTLGDLRAAILLLTDLGKQVARTIRVEPVPSEWEQLMQAHGGERQAKHAALCCAFTYQARRRGWNAALCPTVSGPSQPDIEIRRGDERIYVEVEAESGEPERRMRKWRNQAELQGFVALCAHTAAVRQRIVAEARAAARHGRATDIRWLMREEPLWADVW